ncbi:MAG: hypothetical protein V1898_01905 [Patescibacteria group bacterium]
MDAINSKPTHLVIGILLIIVGIFMAMALILVYSQADSVNANVNIANADPNVDSVYVSATANGGEDSWDTVSGIPLVSGGNKEMHINGTVSDTNGYQDITSVNAVFHMSDRLVGCFLDRNQCYKIEPCDLTGGSGSTINYDCVVELAYWTNSSMAGGSDEDLYWVPAVRVFDDSGADLAIGSNQEVATLLSLLIPTDTIAYGTLSAGEGTSDSDNFEMVFTQRGNDEADIEVTGTDMPCSIRGYLPKENQTWALADVGYSDGSPLTSDLLRTHRNVIYRTDEIIPMRATLYWNIIVNASDNAEGVCTGTNIFTITEA